MLKPWDCGTEINFVFRSWREWHLIPSKSG